MVKTSCFQCRGVQIQSLGRELRFHMSHSAVKKKILELKLCHVYPKVGQKACSLFFPEKKVSEFKLFENSLEKFMRFIAEEIKPCFSTYLHDFTYLYFSFIILLTVFPLQGNSAPFSPPPMPMSHLF